MDPIFCHKVWTDETWTGLSTQGRLFPRAAGRQSPALVSTGLFSTCFLPQGAEEAGEARGEEERGLWWDIMMLDGHACWQG